MAPALKKRPCIARAFVQRNRMRTGDSLVFKFNNGMRKMETRSPRIRDILPIVNRTETRNEKGDGMKSMNLTPEQKEKAKACTTSEELIALAQEEGLDLSDEQLESVAGGDWGKSCDSYDDPCPGDNPWC